MNEQNAPQNPKNQIGTGEGESPITQFNPQSINFRTQSSDIKSMSQSGGGRPEPYTLENAPIKPNSTKEEPRKAEATFKPPQIPSTSSTPPTPPASMGVSPAQAEPPHSSSKRIFGIIIGLIVLIGLAFVGYAVVYPVFFERAAPSSENAIDVGDANNNSPTDVFPAINQGTDPDPLGENASSDLSVSNEVEASALESGDELVSSVFLSPPSYESSISLDSLSYENIIAALNSEKDNFTTGAEIKLSLNDKKVTARELVNTLYPGLLSDNVLSSLGAYSLFLFKDQNGSWPGLAIQLNGSNSVSSFAPLFQADFEKIPPSTLPRLYLSNPGAAGSSWAQGKTQDVANRYFVFGTGNTAVSLNYGWFGETLLISSSYDGFKKALEYLR